MADRRHTRFYSYNQPNMPDQVSANKNMAIGDAQIKVAPVTVQIFQLPAMVNPDVCPKPIPFGGMGEPVNQNEILRLTIRVTDVD